MCERFTGKTKCMFLGVVHAHKYYKYARELHSQVDVENARADGKEDTCDHFREINVAVHKQFESDYLQWPMNELGGYDQKNRNVWLLTTKTTRMYRNIT